MTQLIVCLRYDDDDDEEQPLSTHFYEETGPTVFSGLDSWTQ